jgi:4a-hydroxytetrahydrobiopterin dehydratase
MSSDTVIAEVEVQARLARELPHWYFEDGTIRRRIRTSGWKATLMVVNVIGHLAEAAWHHPDLSVSYAFVVVKLTTHSAGGITKKDFQLAHKLEEVVNWQPGLSSESALTGPPQDDPRLRYIKFDEA